MNGKPQKKIIHIDMDAFFASVEMRDDPSLASIPIAIGGDPGRRGVLCTANYPARKFGVRSAMPSWKAMQLCPELKILYPNSAKYKAESKEIRRIFEKFTDKIEPLSLDEAYLDVSETPDFGNSATLIAQEIRRQIYESRGLTASAGIAPNKLLAKIASDWEKPNGQKVVPPWEVADFIQHLPVSKIFGVGKSTMKELEAIGVVTCGDLQKTDLMELEHRFGSRGVHFYHLCRGIDHREVEPSRERKSLSVERTFAEDLETKEQALPELKKIFEEFIRRLEALEASHKNKGHFVKLKYSDFTTTTHEMASHHVPNFSEIESLFVERWEEKPQPLRLLGAGVKLQHSSEEQLTFW